jgi:hypothetical protein
MDIRGFFGSGGAVKNKIAASPNSLKKSKVETIDLVEERPNKKDIETSLKPTVSPSLVKSQRPALVQKEQEEEDVFEEVIPREMSKKKRKVVVEEEDINGEGSNHEATIAASSSEGRLRPLSEIKVRERAHAPAAAKSEHQLWADK